MAAPRGAAERAEPPGSDDDNRSDARERLARLEERMKNLKENSAAKADIVEMAASLRESVREEVESVRKEIKQDRRWTITTMLAAGVFVVGAITVMDRLGLL